jgi:hypothetical protein
MKHRTGVELGRREWTANLPLDAPRKLFECIPIAVFARMDRALASTSLVPVAIV